MHASSFLAHWCFVDPHMNESFANTLFGIDSHSAVELKKNYVRNCGAPVNSASWNRFFELFVAALCLAHVASNESGNWNCGRISC